MKIQHSVAVIIAIGLTSGCATRGGYGMDDRIGIAESADAAELSEQPANERDTYLSLIRRMQGDGLHYASLAHIDAYVARFGSSDRLELLRNDALRATAQYAQADAGYRRLIQNRNAPAAAWHGLGLLAGRREDYLAAAQLFSEAVKRAPTDVGFLNDYGYASLRAGHRDVARIAITQAAELDPANQKAVSNLALFLLTGGDRQAAEAVMDKAGLATPTRTAVRELARRMATPAQAPTPATDASVAVESVAQSTRSTPPTPTRRMPRNEDFVIKSMLDRFNGG